jgi:hypothetical protein
MQLGDILTSDRKQAGFKRIPIKINELPEAAVLNLS